MCAEFSILCLLIFMVISSKQTDIDSEMRLVAILVLKGFVAWWAIQFSCKWIETLNLTGDWYSDSSLLVWIQSKLFWVFTKKEL
jgi:hypothetical protein